MNDDKQIKKLRKKLKIKQGDFALRISTTQGHVSDIENGRKNLSERTIKLICSEFNVNEHWLRTGEGETFNSSPYEKELIKTFDGLSAATQEYLLIVAKELLNTEKKIISQTLSKAENINKEITATLEEQPVQDIPQKEEQIIDVLEEERNALSKFSEEQLVIKLQNIIDKKYNDPSTKKGKLHA